MLWLHIQDILFTLLHLAIIGFNLTGWLWRRTRRAHLILVILTAASWFILGIWYGMGYCPITEWQWDVKEQLGEKNLPASFVTYYAEQLTGRHFSDAFINNVVAGSFASAAILSIYFNFFKDRKKRTKPAR
jgi:hypothetical protein